jgi:hypothetical protein
MTTEFKRDANIVKKIKVLGTKSAKYRSKHGKTETFKSTELRNPFHSLGKIKSLLDKY